MNNAPPIAPPIIPIIRIISIWTMVFVVVLGLLGNLFYQLITAHNYGLAIERSFFQMIACIAVWLMGRNPKKTE